MTKICNAVTRLRELDQLGKPWLVLGKGPTLAALTPELVVDKVVVTINHALKVVPRGALALVSHFTDLEALRDCIVDVSHRRPRLVVPYHPHVAMNPGQPTIFQYAAEKTTLGIVLNDLSESGDLWAYNSDRAGKLSAHAELTEVRVRLFSAVAVFNLLGLAGVRKVFTLGVDGGTKYDKRMDPKTRLKNGQKTFDVQNGELAKAMVKHSMEWVKL